MHSLASALLILVLLAGAAAYPSQAGTCDASFATVQGGMGGGFANSNGGLSISAPTWFTNDMTYNITIVSSNTDTSTFKGILLYAVSNNTRQGTFEMLPSTIQFKNCPGENATVTHKSPALKSLPFMLTWRAPMSNVGNITWNAVVVTTNRTTWFVLDTVMSMYYAPPTTPSPTPAPTPAPTTPSPTPAPTLPPVMLSAGQISFTVGANITMWHANKTMAVTNGLLQLIPAVSPSRFTLAQVSGANAMGKDSVKLTYTVSAPTMMAPQSVASILRAFMELYYDQGWMSVAGYNFTAAPMSPQPEECVFMNANVTSVPNVNLTDVCPAFAQCGQGFSNTSLLQCVATNNLCTPSCQSFTSSVLAASTSCDWYFSYEQKPWIQLAAQADAGCDLARATPAPTPAPVRTSPSPTAGFVVPLGANSGSRVRASLLLAALVALALAFV